MTQPRELEPGETLADVRSEMDDYLLAVEDVVGRPLKFWKETLALERAMADDQIEYWGRKYADLRDEVDSTPHA